MRGGWWPRPLSYLAAHIEPGVALYDLDRLAEDFIHSRGAARFIKAIAAAAAATRPSPA